LSEDRITVWLCSTTKREVDERVYRAWAEEPVDVQILTPAKLHVTDKYFQLKRRIVAEEESPGEFYIVADDDVVPSANFVLRALKCSLRHSGVGIMFAILSPWPCNETINPWTPEGYEPFVDDEVAEHVSVGCIRVCRKTGLKFPPMTSPWYDGTHCIALRDMGYRVGHMRNVTAIHLGKGASTIAAAR